MDVFTLAELAAKLKLLPKTVKRLVLAGELPEPLMTSPGTKVWTQEDIDEYFYRLRNRHRFRKKAAPGPPKKLVPPGP